MVETPHDSHPEMPGVAGIQAAIGDLSGKDWAREELIEKLYAAVYGREY